jgi:DNA-binding CsgD family transcriptional regulator
VLADDAEAEALYELALAADLSAWPLDRARLHLAYGTWLRRHRRAAESRQPLRRAREVFDALGARSWAAQARRELRAAGERSGDLDRLQVQVQGLTAQELQIARLAAQGLNNREIGQRMRASHRTVGSHLYRIFPKLGITSRQQLAAVLKDIGPVDSMPSSA